MMMSCPFPPNAYCHLCYSISRLSDEAERHQAATAVAVIIVQRDEKDWKEKEEDARLKESQRTEEDQVAVILFVVDVQQPHQLLPCLFVFLFLE